VTPRAFRVALTGGIATGKTSCLRVFAALGAPVIDADTLARAAVEPGTTGLSAVAARFGHLVLTADGTLDREALGRVVFADPSARRDLEAIIHPAVYAAIEDWFNQLNGQKPFGIADVPLLYETGRTADFDRVVVAACDPAEQKRRVMARDGLSETEADQRIAAQLPIAHKRAQADYVIDTSGDAEETERQVVEIWERLQAESGRTG
jgi:dephospho-CoA kinase